MKYLKLKKYCEKEKEKVAKLRKFKESPIYEIACYTK